MLALVWAGLPLAAAAMWFAPWPYGQLPFDCLLGLWMASFYWWTTPRRRKAMPGGSARYFRAELVAFGVPFALVLLSFQIVRHLQTIGAWRIQEEQLIGFSMLVAVGMTGGWLLVAYLIPQTRQLWRDVDFADRATRERAS